MPPKIRLIAPVPKQQDVAQYNDTAVQDTWNVILDTTVNVLVEWLTFRMETLAEDIEYRITMDGLTPIVGTQAAAVAGSTYYVYLRGLPLAGWSATITTTQTPAGYATFMPMRSVKVEIRKTSNNGANTLRGAVGYAKW